MTEGTDAQAEVSVRLSEARKTVTAKGADPDTLVVSAKAYLGALNRLMVKRLRTKPQPMMAEVENIRRTERGLRPPSLLAQRERSLSRTL